MSATKGIITQTVSYAAWDGFAVVPSDTVNFTSGARILYVGTTGDISILTPAGNTLLFKNVPVGFFYMAAKRVNSTGTTATNIVGLY